MLAATPLCGNSASANRLTANGSLPERNDIRFGHSIPSSRNRHLVLSSLVRPLGVIILHVLSAKMIHVPEPEHDEVIQALLLNRFDKTLDEGVRVRGAECRPAEYPVGQPSVSAVFWHPPNSRSTHHEAGPYLCRPYACRSVSATARVSKWRRRPRQTCPSLYATD